MVWIVASVPGNKIVFRDFMIMHPFRRRAKGIASRAKGIASRAKGIASKAKGIASRAKGIIAPKRKNKIHQISCKIQMAGAVYLRSLFRKYFQ